MDVTSTGTFDLPIFEEEATQGLSMRSSIGSAEIRRFRPPAVTTINTDALPAALTANWTRLNASNFSAKFYTRLLRLAGERFNNAVKKEPLRSESLSNFLRFWEHIKAEAREPDVAISKDGSIHAEWFKSRRQHLDMKFLDDRILFGLIDGDKILEGAESRELVHLILTSHGSKPFQWST
jgi:hypothetical protein